MPRIARTRKGADVLFVGAVILLVAGAWLLPVTAGGAARPGRLWPLLLVGAGAIWIYLAVSRRFISSAVFGGTLLGLGGLILVAAEFLHLRMARIWPLFMVALGLALMAAGLSRFRHPRTSYMVPAICFAGLGLFFSVFSFDLTDLSFTAFIRAYWPLSFVLASAGLFAAWGLGRAVPPVGNGRKRKRREGP